MFARVRQHHTLWYVQHTVSTCLKLSASSTVCLFSVCLQGIWPRVDTARCLHAGMIWHAFTERVNWHLATCLMLVCMPLDVKLSKCPIPQGYTQHVVIWGTSAAVCKAEKVSDGQCLCIPIPINEEPVPRQAWWQRQQLIS